MGTQEIESKDFVVEEREDCKVLRVRKNIDFGNVEDFGRAVEALIETSATNIVFDLAEVSFVNSTAIGILALTYRAMKRREGKLVLVVTAPEIQRLLAVSNFTELFFVVDTMEEALGAL